MPLVLYNVPSRTGCNIEPATIERLARIGNVVAIKEAGGSLDQVSEILARTDLTVLSGDDALTLPMLAVGAEGVVSVAANLVPRDVIALLDAFRRGDLAEARRRHARLFPLCRALMGVASNPIPVKTALALLGRGTGELRLPLCPPDVHGRERSGGAWTAMASRSVMIGLPVTDGQDPTIFQPSKRGTNPNPFNSKEVRHRPSARQRFAIECGCDLLTDGQ